MANRISGINIVPGILDPPKNIYSDDSLTIEIINL